MKREALHLEPLQTIFKATASAAAVLLSLIFVPVCVYEAIARRSWFALPMLVIVALQLYLLTHFSLRAQKVFARRHGIEVERGGWKVYPWSDLAEVERVGLQQNRPIALFRIPIVNGERPLLFYGNAATEIRVQELQRRAKLNGGAAWGEAEEMSGTESGADITTPVDPALVMHLTSDQREQGMLRPRVDSARITAWVPRVAVLFAAVSAANVGGLVFRGLWSWLPLHVAASALLVCAARVTAKTVRLYASSDHLVIGYRDGRVIAVPWFAVPAPVTPRWAAILPISLARIYELPLFNDDSTLFFADGAGLRSLQLRRARGGSIAADGERTVSSR